MDDEEDPESGDGEDDEDGTGAVQEEPIEEARHGLRRALIGHPPSRRPPQPTRARSGEAGPTP